MIPYEDPTTLSLLYHINSEPWLNTEAYEAAGYEVDYKQVSSGGGPLPLADPAGSRLLELLRSRESCRQYEARTMSAEVFSTMLKAAYGVVRLTPLPGTGDTGLFRTVPSAGGLFPLDLFILTIKVEGVPDGLFHYNVRDHTLEPIRTGEFSNELDENMLAGPFIRNANAVIFLTATFKRTQKKYGPRGYRYILLEAGHVAQNICLIATEQGLGSLCMGGFFDSAINRFLGLDGATEAAVYGVAVGYAAETVSK